MATMSTRQPSRVIFIGNIPYGLSEEQIVDIFSSVGTVERFRLVYDQETGRPKGFGFADYPDIDSAASAVRNLNGHEVMGRNLRVDFSNEQKGGDDDRDASQSHQATNGAAAGYAASGSSIPPLPTGKDLPPGVKCTDAISQTLNTLPPTQLLDVVAQMKHLATNEPQRATELLQQAPQLAAAVFQTLLLMGLVSREAVASVVEGGAAQAPPPAVQQPYGAPPPGYGAPPPNPTPPVGGMPYAPPAPQGYGAPAAAPPPAAAPAPAAGNTDDLMRQVLELPESQIALLPEADRQQILALRAQFAAQRR